MECEARQGKARPGQARQGKARQGQARRGEARQGKARQGKAGEGRQGMRTPKVCVFRGERLLLVFSHPSLGNNPEAQENDRQADPGVDANLHLQQVGQQHGIASTQKKESKSVCPYNKKKVVEKH